MDELETMPLRFRVWDKAQGRFILENADLDEYASMWREAGVGGEGEIVSQDTGLVDKNDVPIFVGDIVRCKTFDNPKFDITGEVTYSCEACWVTTKDETHKEMLGIFFEKEVEVIGNIWEGVNNGKC